MIVSDGQPAQLRKNCIISINIVYVFWYNSKVKL